MKNKNISISFKLLAVIAFMFFLTFASVPLYKLFCQVTGYGGTPKVADNEFKSNVSDKSIKIEFNSDINKKLNWSFKPAQRSIKTRIGESVLAFYTAKNNSDESITGVATYNILPFEAGQYFNKMDCFCFQNQTLKPGEEVTLPVNFYIDPKILDDVNVRHLKSIVLSYTFFESQENIDKYSENKK